MPRRYLLGALAIFAALAAVSMVSFYDNRELYLEVDQLLAGEGRLPAPVMVALAAPSTGESPGPGAPLEPRLQLRGKVDDRTVDRGEDGLEMRFELFGRDGAVPVLYEGLVPDTFDQAVEVTVAGRMTDSGLFVADELFVQCPSKYEAMPPGSQAAADEP